MMVSGVLTISEAVLIAFVRQMANITFILWYECYIFGNQVHCIMFAASPNTLFPRITPYILSHQEVQPIFK